MLDSRKEGRRERGNEPVGADRGPPLHTRIAAVLKRIAGMPDYAAYTAHLRRSHPEKPIPTQREFYEEFMRHRYQDGPTRCC